MPLPMPQQVPEKGFYYHYKHDPNGTVNNYAYEVMGVGFHTEDARPGEAHFLVYRPLYEASVYKASKELDMPCFDNRPLEMWMEEVEKDGKKFPRFQRITDSAAVAELERIRSKMYP
ncbi:MAG: DUF1653 domain-containing protein [Minisyncoccota bacterium]